MKTVRSAIDERLYGSAAREFAERKFEESGGHNTPRHMSKDGFLFLMTVPLDGGMFPVVQLDALLAMFGALNPQYSKPDQPVCVYGPAAFDFPGRQNFRILQPGYENGTCAGGFSVYVRVKIPKPKL